VASTPGADQEGETSVANLPIPDVARDLALGAARASLRAGANVGERVFRGRLADTRLSPHTVVLDEPHCQVRRHDPSGPRHALPIVFVPPLGGTARVFDIRRGASMAQWLADSGFRVYVLDYGPLGFEDRALSLADFVDGCVARAVEVASEDCGGAQVILAGWCAGGVFAALYATSRAARSRVAALALLASPLDLRGGHPLYPLARLPITEGALRIARETGLPAPLVSLVFKMTSPVKQLTRPLTVLRNLDDRDFLVHFESLREYVDAFAAYPGRAGYELVRGLVDSAVLDGTMHVGRRRADVRRIGVPVMVLAGTTDVLAPAKAVQAWCDVLPDTEYHVVPGGHLGVMAGRRAPESTWRRLRDFAERVDAEVGARGAPPRIRVVRPRPKRRSAAGARKASLPAA
jgi:polyhydroxyalkanoate synthase